MKGTMVFIGLGNMGLPMALNLAGFGAREDLKAEAERPTVAGHDLMVPSVQRFADAGGQAAGDLMKAVSQADVVVTMLPAGKHVRASYLGSGSVAGAGGAAAQVGEDGLLAHMRKGALAIDCSTIDPATARDVASAAKARGVSMVDAPVSGGTGGAQAGTLTFMVGGDTADLERARPILQRMGKAIFHAGGAGAGQAAKACNNMMLGIQMLGACEALRLGIANGLDPAVLSEIMTKSSGRNWVLELYNPCPGVMPNVPASRGYEGGFATELMAKDMGLAQQSAEGVGVSIPLGALARQLYDKHVQAGSGKLDFSSVFKGDS